MRFLYHAEAGLETLTVEGEAYRYLFKVRRHRRGERVGLRHMRDDTLFWYRIDTVGRREAVLRLESSGIEPVMPEHPLHLAWCVVDPKTIEKTLPMLNELGVGRLSFVYCARSQKNFRLDFSRFERILINSSQQCGRSRLMALELFESLADYFEAYPDSFVLDFGGEPIDCKALSNRVLIGCEGGFSEDERKLFKEKGNIIGLNTSLVLRSETAALTLAAGSVLT
ncbi:MAG: 16S rRNA (uracil(1498)-N(3))-methyltransferase [Epsilonproteobacteria bacterium]|nr:16S rRNA (uracil(1498)-N(3))-methyltransferase [Campylobacterota bacterium]